jgi:hypothetical protein
MSVMPKIVNNQLKLVKTIDKINFILTNTDGFTTKAKNVQVSISGTSNVDRTSKNVSNTYSEMTQDMTTLGVDMLEYYNQIFTDNNKLVENPWNEDMSFSIEFDEGAEYARFMNVMYQEILNSEENIITKLLHGRINEINKWVRYVNNIVGDLNTDYKKVERKTERELNKFSKRSSVKKFNDYSPFSKEKERTFLYINLPKDYINTTKDGYFNLLYSGLNQGPKTDFNGKNTFN